MRRSCLLLLFLSASTPAWSQAFAPMALNSFSAPPARIQNAQVWDQSGRAVGTVQDVKTDANGKPVLLDIRLPNGTLTRIAASDASYEPASNVVVARVPAAAQVKPARPPALP